MLVIIYYARVHCQFSSNCAIFIFQHSPSIMLYKSIYKKAINLSERFGFPFLGKDQSRLIKTSIHQSLRLVSESIVIKTDLSLSPRCYRKSYHKGKLLKLTSWFNILWDLMMQNKPHNSPLGIAHKSEWCMKTVIIV